MRARIGLVTLAAIAAPGTAHAGRDLYGWLYGTEVMPERGAEIQAILSEENNKPGNTSETDWWLQPAIGITDQLELVLPVQFSWSKQDVGTPPTSVVRSTFDNYGAELRYRFVTQDPVDAPDFVPLVRVAVKRLVTGTRDIVRPEADIVASYKMGPAQVLVDIGMVAEINSNAQNYEIHPGAGVSIEAIGDLRFGAEVFAEIPFQTDDTSWVVAGPNMAWSHGRTWVSASYGIGLYKIRDAPRLQWGIAF